MTKDGLPADDPVDRELDDLVQQVGESMIRDDRTGLYHARHFDFILETELSRSQRYGYDFSLVLFDIEELSHVTDSLRDQMEAKLLVEVGQKVKSCCRLIDFAFHWGDGEFAAVLPQTSKQNGCVWARRLHQVIRDTNSFESAGPRVHVTASVGIASYPTDSVSKAELLDLANEARLLVKNSAGDGVAAANVGILTFL